MAEHKTIHGILALIDIVNYTGQSVNLGEKYTGQYTAYFQERIRALAGKHGENGFKVIKFLGDAALLFGQEPGTLLDLMLDLFERDKPEDKFGFLSRFRIAAHSGYFQFQTKNRRIVDLVCVEGIKVFRLEKYAGPGQLVVTHELYQGLKAHLTANHVEAVKLPMEESLKGFDSEDWYPPFYKLTYTGKAQGAANLLEQRLEELEHDVRFIRVFGDMYPPVPMEKNFINLSILCDWYLETEPSDDLTERFSKKSPLVKHQQDDWIYMERWERKHRGEFRQIDVDTLYRDENRTFTNGVIFGLPGAGKTTILRHLAHKEFTANQTREPGKKKINLLVPCRDILFYDIWHKERYGAGEVTPNANTALEYLTWVFLFGNKTGGAVTPEQRVEFNNACQKVKQAFKEERLLLLVDALDEAPDIPCKERIAELVLLMVSKNRLFLTSRPSERVHLRQDKMPEFNVLSLTQDQVRGVALQVMDGESSLYKKFDRAIWQEEYVTRMAATPITAILVTAYFQAYGQFEHRYPMYDLLMKFILVKSWEKIKTDDFPYKNLELFFREVKKQGFFGNYPDAAAMYDGLGSLCYSLFFEGADGRVQRQVNDRTLVLHFREVIAGAFHYGEDKAAGLVDKWIERFQLDHLLLQGGAGEYMFIHSTIMEYLAAFYIGQKTGKDKAGSAGLAAAALKKEEFLALETLPIAAGHGLLTGYDILSVIRDLKVDYELGLLRAMGVRCLAEVEWQITKLFQGLRIETMKKSFQDIIRQNRQAVEWLYDYLKTAILSSDKATVKENIEQFATFTRLSQPTLLSKYLGFEAFDQGDSELVGLRKQLLENLVQKELVEGWLKEREKFWLRLGKVIEYETVLQLDTPGYHPEDKNFKYFQQLIGKELAGFLGSPNMRHSVWVRGCAFSPDGKYMVSASDDGTLKLWEVESGKEIRAFTGHKGGVNSCAFSPGGERLVSASADKTLKLWEVESGKEIRTFKGHTDFVYSCAFSPGGERLVSASDDRTLKLWEVESGKEIRAFTGHKNSVLSCAFSPGGERLVSASDDRTLKLWEVESGKEIRALTGHNAAVYSCAFSPDGTRVVSASSDNTLKLWEVESGTEIRTFKGHKDRVWGCAFSPGGERGERLVSASWDNTLKLWEVDSGKEIRAFTGHTAGVNSCAFSPCGERGERLVSASRDHTLKLWDVESGTEIRAFTGHKDRVLSCAFSPDGDRAVSASEDRTLKLWEVESGKEIRALTGHMESVYSCAFSPGGERLVSASLDNTLKLWDVSSGKEIRALTGHTGSVYSCAFSPGGERGERLVSASYDGTLKLWEVDSGKEIRAFTGHTAGVNSCAFSPGGERLVSASYDGTLKLWEVSSGKEIRAFTGHTAGVNSCAFSPGGERLVSASYDGTLKLWDVSSGTEIRAFTGHKDVVRSCAFSPGGERLVSASYDKTIKLWEVESGQCLKTLALPWIPRYVAFSPTNPHLVCTANANSTLTFFDFKDV